MKKRFICLMCLLFLLALTGCKDSGVPKGAAIPETEAAQTALSGTAPSATEAAAPENHLPAILEGTGSFHSPDFGGEVTVEEYLSRMGGNAEVTFSISKAAVLDMDGDGEKEAVLTILVGEGNGYGVLVLHNEETRTVGFTFSNRQLGELKEDGTYSWSGGASHNGVSRLAFDGNGWYTETVLACVDMEDAAQPYAVDGRAVDEDTYWAWQDAQDAKPCAPWQDWPLADPTALFQ